MAADEGVAELQRSQRPLAHKPVLALRNRRAMVRIMFKAKCGVLLMRNKNCFSAIGTTFTSVAAPAVALRGAIALGENGLAGFEVARRRARARQYSEIDRCIRHVAS